jgi:hypothetical protein
MVPVSSCFAHKVTIIFVYLYKGIILWLKIQGFYVETLNTYMKFHDSSIGAVHQ